MSLGDIFNIRDESGIERLVGTINDPLATTGDVLTVQSDKSIKAAPGGGGSGPQVVTVPISSAQILALHTTPVVLIPGVAGKVAVVGEGCIAYVAGATPYTDNGGDATVIQAGQDIAQASGAGFWDQAASQVYAFGYGIILTGPAAGFAGHDVVLTSHGANPTLGDGTLKVTLSYFLAPTV